MTLSCHSSALQCSGRLEFMLMYDLKTVHYKVCQLSLTTKTSYIPYNIRLWQDLIDFVVVAHTCIMHSSLVGLIKAVRDASCECSVHMHQGKQGKRCSEHLTG